jgi:hypothetical protein
LVMTSTRRVQVALDLLRLQVVSLSMTGVDRIVRAGTRTAGHAMSFAKIRICATILLNRWIELSASEAPAANGKESEYFHFLSP